MKKYIKPTLEVSNIDANNIMCASGVDNHQGITWDATTGDDTYKPDYKPFKPFGGLEQW